MRIIFLACIFCLFHPVLTRVSRIHPDEDQKDLLHQTFKNLLNIEDDPDQESAPKRALTKSARAASKYMKRLFERYRKHQIGQDADSEKTVVRAILPALGRFQNRDALIFDLHPISPTERVVKAELHYYLGKYPSPVPKKVRCFILAPSNANPAKVAESELDSAFDWDDAGQSSNWAVFDALRSVNSTLRDSRASNDTPTLAILFAKGPKESGPARLVNPRKSLRFHAPFLSVSTRDSSTLSISEGVRDREDEEEDEGESEDSSAEPGRRKREVESKYYEYYHPYETPFTTSPNDVAFHWRDRQPETTTSDLIQRGPSVLRRTSQSSKARRAKKRRGGSSLGRRQDQYLNDAEAWAPFEDKARAKKRKYGKVLKARDDDHNPTTVVLLDGKPDETSVSCQRNDLVVDFQDIGWGDYVIAPSSFEAHYCAGSCNFPLPATVNATNHAIVMDIIQKIRLHPQLPKPCCAPEKMDSLSLLYYDANGNVVLTTYPKMSVVSCACL